MVLDGSVQRVAAVSWAVGVAALVGAGAAPTGAWVIDVLWIAGFVGVLVVAAPLAGPGARFGIVGVAALAVAVDPSIGVASAAVVAAGAAGSAWLVQPSWWAASAVAALVAVCGIDGGGLPHATSAMLAAALAVPLVASAWQGVPTHEREQVRHRLRWLTWSAWTLAGLVVVLGAIGAAELRSGADAADAALVALEAGDRDGASTALAEAQTHFDRAAVSFRGPWTVPARAVPLLGVQLDAARAAAEAGSDVAGEAGGLVLVADLGRLRSDAGVVDLGRLRSVADELDQTAVAVDGAFQRLDRVRSPWLAPPVAAGLETLRSRVGDARDDALLARQLAATAPAMLGADGPRRYLILVTSPAEARELGGFVASVAEIEAVDGDLVLVRSERSSTLNDLGAPRRLDPAGLPERFVRYQPERWWQDVSGLVDFPSVGRVAAELWEQQFARPVDAVLAMDPYALGALVELTGPVTVDGLDVPLDGAALPAYLLREQYLAFPELADRPERVDVLSQVADAAFRRLTTGAAPSPARIGAVLGPVAGQGRLLLWSTRAPEQDLARRLGVDGAFPDAAAGDVLAVVHANANPSKVDSFLHRAVRHEVRIDPSTGALDATLEVALDNDAPDGGLPDYVIGSARHDRPPGTNHLLLSVFSPHDLLDASVDGQAVVFERTAEQGVWRWSAFVDVPPGARVVVRLHLGGTVGPGAYRLQVAGQPLVHDDDVEVGVTVDGPWTIDAVDGATRGGGRSASSRTTGPADHTVVVGLVPEDASVSP